MGDRIAEWVNAYVVHHRDQGSNLGLDKIFSDFVSVKLEFESVGC
jgi:hypothetical protein